MTHTQPTLLVIDDEESICTAFERFFSPRGWRVTQAATAEAGLAAWRSACPEVTFLDVRLPDGSGLDLLDQLAADPRASAIVVMTAYGDMSTVLRAMQGKAFEYLPKPIDLDRALATANRAAEAVRRYRAGESTSSPPAASEALLVGSSRAMQEVYKRIARLSLADCPVLIEGPTGTGKELAARAIHVHSARRAGPFAAVNCGAIPANLVESELFGRARGGYTGADADAPGQFEAASGGTLLLDEIGELPPEAQVKLLRVLDTHRVQPVGSTRTVELDVRVLAATNRDLQQQVQRGEFREDLYYRLAVATLEMPPLCGRREDVGALAEHFLARQGRDVTLSDEARRRLTRYAWPGNVRQLRNVIQQAATLAAGGIIGPEDLPELSPAASGPGPDAAEGYVEAIDDGPGDLYRRAVEPVERAVIVRALRACRGHRGRAAELLGLHRNTLRKKLKELGIDADAQ
jgi:two-component system nitrogen regulation response regulator GlnG